jgi:hypothetical protein
MTTGLDGTGAPGTGDSTASWLTETGQDGGGADD